MKPWMEKGCDHCRSWFTGNLNQEPLRKYPARHEYLYHCRFCFAWWTDNQGHHPYEITEDLALQLLREANPPREQPPSAVGDRDD
jgi:hypothetical protein